MTVFLRGRWTGLAAAALLAAGCAGGGLPVPRTESALPPGVYPNINIPVAAPDQAALPPGSRGPALDRLRTEGAAATREATTLQGLNPATPAALRTEAAAATREATAVPAGDAAANAANLRQLGELARRCALITDPAALPQECR